MKRVYRTPKAKMIDFCYDEQVTATSDSGIATYGDPQHIGRCQQSSDTTCTAFWNDSYPGKCTHLPFSLRQGI